MQAYVLLTIFAAFFYGVSVALQKKGIGRISGKKIRLFKKYSVNWKIVKKLLNKYFLFGIGIGFVGTLMWLKAMSIGEISVIQSLLNLSIVVTWIVGIVYLKERLNSKEWFAVLLIFAGAIILSVIA